jgi:enoyl-CoA hydratase/carnithine racemase
MAAKTLLLSKPADGVALITLNRPDQRNAIDMAMQEALEQLLCQLEQDDNVRAIVLTGAGDKAFSAGYDIHEMQAFDQDKILLAQLQREPRIWHIANYSKPLIGAINGVAHGAGAIIATALDIRVGCSRTDFRYTAVRYGGANNTWQLPPVVGFAKAKEFLLSGRSIGAEEAFQAGLLNHVVADDQALAKAIEIAVEIAANPPEGVRWTKKLIHENLGRDYESAYRAENAVMMTKIAPKPPGQLFTQFLAKHSAPKSSSSKNTRGKK